MKSIIISLVIVAVVVVSGFGQDTQNTKNTSDQVLRSTGRVNSSTLGMEFDLPIGNYSGRGFNLPLGLSYSSKVWRFEDASTTPASGHNPTRIYTYGVYSTDAAAGWTSSLAQPYIEYTGEMKRFDPSGRPGDTNGDGGNRYIKRITVFLPGGESHELRADNAYVEMPSPTPSPSATAWPAPPSSVWDDTFYSYDGSGLKYVQGGGVYRLYMPDGSFYDFSSTRVDHTWSPSQVRKGIRLTDVNGNYAEYKDPEPENNFPYGYWIDQLDRKFPIMLPLDTPQHKGNSGPFTDYFTLPGMSNPYVFTWNRLEEAFGGEHTLSYVGAFAMSSTGTPSYSPALFASGNYLHGVCGLEYSKLYVLGMTFNQKGEDAWSEFNPVVLTSIELPNGAAYQFKYNEYGEVERIYYPAGGHEEFEYDQVASLANMNPEYQKTNRGVIESRVYENDSDPTPMTSSYSAAVSDNNYRTSVIAPDGTQTDNFMHRGIPQPACNQIDYPDPINTFNARWGYDNALAGKTYETRVFSADSTPHIVQRTLTKWEYSEDTNVPVRNYPLLNLQYNARVFSTQSISYDGSNKIATVTKFEYDTDKDAPGSPLNVVKKKEYSYGTITDSNTYSPATSTDLPPSGVVTLSDPTTGLTPVRVTQTTYNTATAYRNRNILKLPMQILVTDGASTPSIKAKTEISYDDGTYLVADSTTGTVPGWATPEASPSPFVRGLPTITKSWYDPADSNAYVQTRVQYNQFGSPRKTWDGNNNLTQIEYTDNFSNSSDRHTYAFATKTISAVPDGDGSNGSNSSFETHTKYQYPSGLPVSTIDINGQETTMVYDDALLRPTLVTSPNGQQTITEYGEGTNASTRWIKVKSQIDEAGLYDFATWKESTTWYDGLMRTIRSQSKDDESGDVFALTCYDTSGRVSKVSNPFRGYTNQTCSTTTGMAWTTNTFDSEGRPWKVTSPDSAFVETDYSLITSGSQIGTAVTVTDQAGKLRRSVTNALGHLIRVDEPGPSSQLDDSGTPTQPTVYSYDLLNNLLTVTQAGNTTQQCGGSSSCSQTRTFVYDALSRLTSATNPESGTISYLYDANANLTSKKDARNITTSYTYDALNRVTQRSYATPTATPTPGTYQNSPTVTYYYDGANVSGGIANSKSKLTKVTSSVSTTEYIAFDILGRVTASKQTTDGGASAGYIVGYTYNLAGGLVEETYPSGRVVKNVLDHNGDLSIVKSRKNGSSGFWNYADGFAYSPSGAVTSMQLGNGRWEKTEFNARLQPIQIALGTVQNGTDKLKLDYSYGTTNNNGNILNQTITVDGSGCPGPACMANGFNAVQTYTYDSLNRIKSATEIVDETTTTWNQTFNYDRFGNRKFDEAYTSMPQSFANPPVTNPSISPNNNRITSAGWAYDAAGNTLTDAGSQTYVYDGENKMVKASNGSGTLGEYYYDGDGKRVKKIAANDGGTTIFVYDAGGKLVAEYSFAAASTEDAKVAYLTNDHLGSPRINTDRDGNITARHDYHPFGEEITTTQRTSHSDYTPDSVRKQFTGYERDGETQLDFAQARYYARVFGRFTTVDPVMMAKDRLTDPQAINLYIYTRNNPLRYVDPDGEEFEGTDGKKVIIKRKKVNGKKIWVIESDNASDDLTRLVDLINNSGSKTASKALDKLNKHKTMINLVIDSTTSRTQKEIDSGTTTIGLHQPHDNNGPLTFNEATDKFDGKAKPAVDAKGKVIKGAYEKATITLFEKKMGEIGYSGESLDAKLVATFAHESRHDTDPIQVQAGLTGTGSNDIWHPEKNGKPRKGSPDYIEQKIEAEIERRKGR